jgi:hypothetical protein
MTIVYGVAVALMVLAVIRLVANAVRETRKARERARQDTVRAPADQATGPAVQAKRPVNGMSMSTSASGRNPEDGRETTDRYDSGDEAGARGTVEDFEPA